MLLLEALLERVATATVYCAGQLVYDRGLLLAGRHEEADSRLALGDLCDLTRWKLLLEGGRRDALEESRVPALGLGGESLGPLEVVVDRPAGLLEVHGVGAHALGVWSAERRHRLLLALLLERAAPSRLANLLDELGVLDLRSSDHEDFVAADFDHRRRVGEASHPLAREG